jgi:ethanolamine ammonia-lyase small subunit
MDPPAGNRAIAGQADAESLLAAIRDRTPARVFTGRSGLGYRTATQLALRADHAAAIDAVHAEIDLDRDFGAEFVASRKLFHVQTRAADRQQYLQRPDFGRRLDDAARAAVARCCARGPDLQLVLGDGLSAAAVIRQVPQLLPRLEQLAAGRRWKVGQTFLIRHCRVGVLNDIGELLVPKVAVLLIGERPGLSTAEGLSAYLAYQPQPGDTDARRNLISNIHARGVSCEMAAVRIIALAGELMSRRLSGCDVKETLESAADIPAAIAAAPAAPP